MIDHRLGHSPEDLAAAPLLAAHYNVTVRRPIEAPPPLRTDGTPFLPIPDWLDFRVRLPFDRSRRNRAWRRSLRDSESAWHDAGLTLDLRSAAAFGEHELIETLYFGVFVREYYAKGISPYGAHNLDAFRRLLIGPSLVAAIRSGPVVVGGAVLRAAPPTTVPYRLLAGTVIEAESAVTGIIFALAPAYRSCRRALWGQLADALAAKGVGAFSFGRETPFLDARYTPIVIDKMRWADEITAGSGTSRLWLAADPARAADRRMVVFELDGNDLRLHGFGAEAVEMRDALAVALARRAEPQARGSRIPIPSEDSS